MIPYHPGVGFALIFKLRGSVFPIALRWSIPPTILAAALNLYFVQWAEEGDAVLLNVEGMSTLWSSYSFVLGFLVVFRNNQAYSRFWEGAELIHQVRGEWVNAVSSLVAFCNSAEEKSAEVNKFQHCVVRLVSMLHCSALQQIAEVGDHHFEIFDPTGIDPSRLRFIRDMTPNERCQVLMQWIQRLIVEADQQAVLKIAPPILSRVFQELSRGIVNLHNVAKIKEVQFPFPYAQMIAVMMMVHWFITPVLASQSIKSCFWASFMTFVTVSAFWSAFYIALEIEQPFGDDPNDLPVSELQEGLNRSLSLLLQREVATAPEFTLDACAQARGLVRAESSSVMGAPPAVARGSAACSRVSFAALAHSGSPNPTSASDQQPPRCTPSSPEVPNSLNDTIVNESASCGASKTDAAVAVVHTLGVVEASKKGRERKEASPADLAVGPAAARAAVAGDLLAECRAVVMAELPRMDALALQVSKVDGRGTLDTQVGVGPGQSQPNWQRAQIANDDMEGTGVLPDLPRCQPSANVETLLGIQRFQTKAVL